MNCDLIWLGNASAPPAWPLGRLWTVKTSVCGVADGVQRVLAESDADFVLFWDAGLDAPDVERVREASRLTGDVWHAGLSLGMSALPRWMHAHGANWMLNCDPDPSLEATSWRLSLRACLVRKDVLQHLGAVHPDFQTLEAAALEMGHRYIATGAVTRHVPWLIETGLDAAPPVLPVEDELRFIHFRYGRRWAAWRVMRAVLEGEASPLAAARAWQKVCRGDHPVQPAPFERRRAGGGSLDARVSVLIPTVDRYPYLKPLLAQLREQTVAPLEVIVVDQTAPDRRDYSLSEEFADAPIHVLHQDQAGQCSSRNAGLRVARGDYVLFLDDDDEIPPDLIESHLRSLHQFQADVSCGVADEVGAGPLPPDFRLVRVSDVFPTNNTMIRIELLEKSGLFDLAFDKGARADRDLGTRLYLNGALMMLNPEIRVLHYHAPTGGLRKHKARVITYASSRQTLMQRHLPGVTSFYLAHRYNTARQRREIAWQQVLGTFSIRGKSSKKLLKMLIGAACLPHTLWQLRRRRQAALRMLENYPQIPPLLRANAEPRPFVAEAERVL